MYSVLYLVFVSFALAALLTPLCRDVFVRCGWVDVPNEERKIHSHPIPRAGGLAIALSLGGAVALHVSSPLKGSSILSEVIPLAVRLLPAVLVVFLTGLLDDLLSLKAWQKFAGQFVAAALAISSGFHIHAVAGVESAHWWSYPLTVLWLVGCSNALNLIDGLDGLAAGIGLFAALTMLVAALGGGAIPLGLAAAPVVGALLGFLCFNFNPASVFLGDSGSLLIGFLLGCYGVEWCARAESIFALAAPVMVLAVPILDTTLAIARRFLRRLPLFQADGRHIHHMLLARGFTPRRVALLLYGICCLAAALSLLQTFLPTRFAPLIVVVFVCGVFYGVWKLQYAEFTLLHSLLIGGHFRGLLNAHLLLRSVGKALDKCSGIEECWEVILQSSPQFGFSSVRLKFNGSEFIHSPDGNLPGKLWTLRIDLPGSGYLNLTRLASAQPCPAVALYADTLRARMFSKFPQPQSDPRPRFRSVAIGR